MATTRREEGWMERALALALRGRGKVRTNPMVGCVLVKGGKLVAEGWHARFGGPHAEVAALSKAGSRARGCTAYVTLEPCSFSAKTPPCTDALRRAGVKRVVAAMTDPDPRSRGRGFKALRRAGIGVRVGLLGGRALELNRAYVLTRTRARPYVILKAAASLDGKLGTSRGESKWITGSAARRRVHRLRAAVDGVLVGINTVLADDPELTSHGTGPDPVRIVLDTDLRIPSRSRVLRRGGPLTVIATASRDVRKLSGLRLEHLSLVQVKRKAGGVDLKDLLRRLVGMGIGTLLVEGGGKVHTSFLEEGLVDEVRIFVAPKLIGGAGAPSLFGGNGIGDLARAPRLDPCVVEPVGPDFLFSGRLAGSR